MPVGLVLETEVRTFRSTTDAPGSSSNYHEALAEQCNFNKSRTSLSVLHPRESPLAVMETETGPPQKSTVQQTLLACHPYRRKSKTACVSTVARYYYDKVQRRENSYVDNQGPASRWSMP